MAKVSDFDIVYISYDEPNADENFHHLRSYLPHAKRVHGIKGFDAAHREAGRVASTDHLFVVDGDNRITYDFLLENFELKNSEYIYSWSGKNIINGLIYGNGGIKLWPKRTLENISCHDKSGGAVDWCFKVPYYQMNDWFSYSYCNGSSLQAFRTGFREGVKLSLNSEGERTLEKNGGVKGIPNSNRARLIAWITLGADVPNGIYCMFGARLGLLKAICEKDFDTNLVSDYDWIESYWKSEFGYVRDGHYQEHFDEMLLDIRSLTGFPVANFNPEQSKCAKELILNPRRQGLMNPLLSETHSIINKNFVQKNS